MSNRNNLRLRAIVDRAIIKFETGSKDDAVRMLEDENLSDALIARVLMNPSQRRSYINHVVTRTFAI